MTDTHFKSDLHTMSQLGDIPTPCGGGCANHAHFRVSRRAAIGVGVVAGAALVTACGGSSEAETTPSAAAGTVLAKVADVPAAGSLVVTVNQAPYALAKNPDGTIVAHTAVCTHQRCTVQAAGAKLHCDCHGSEFDAFTGAVLQSPAPSPLAEVAITEADGNVLLA